MNEIEQIRWLNANCPDGGFLQSEGWRMLKEREFFQTQHFERNNFWANVVEQPLPIIGKYWYIPRGPVFNTWQSIDDNQQKASHSHQYASKESWKTILEDAKRRGIGWIRVEPKNEDEKEVLREWSNPFDCRKLPHDIQPREIFIIDITKDEDELLKNMKAKTRYNIRLAEKKGVQVSFDRSESTIQKFLKMIHETAIRNYIKPHSEKHYLNLFKSFSDNALELFVARREEKILAAVAVVFFGDTATYLHGASFDEERNFMATYILQWKAIQEAKKRGCCRYDFGGVDTENFKPSLSGVTRFKQGFSENVKPFCFPGSYDIVLNQSQYRAYYFLNVSKNVVKRVKKLLTKQ